MPVKNTIKFQSDNTYYHVYLRGVNKRKVFIDDSDFTYFQKLFARYMCRITDYNHNGISYPNFWSQLELLTYCLMANHFHLLVYQIEAPALSKFMKSLLSSYTMYFNKKYKRTGPLFESRYKAINIDSDTYLLHISRYIHLNPMTWKSYPYSSINYLGASRPQWLKPEKILSLFTTADEYMKFLYEYVSRRDELNILKKELGDS